MRFLLIGISVLLLLAFISVPALASGPTPTYPPPHATATSASLFLRPTPTLLTIVLSTPIIGSAVGGSAGPMADQAIQAYNTVNSGHIVDFIIFGLVGIFLLMMLVRNIGESTRNR